MKIAIIGSRNINSQDAKNWLKTNIETLQATEIISGGNVQGVGKMTKEISQEMQIQLTEILPNYAQYGKIAPHIRNSEMIKEADAVLCVWDGKSNGTKNEIALTRKYGKKIILLNTGERQKGLF